MVAHKSPLLRSTVLPYTIPLLRVDTGVRKEGFYDGDVAHHGS